MPSPQSQPSLHAAMAYSDKESLARLGWVSAACLLGFMALAHLGVLLCFFGGWRVPGFLAPLALLLAVLIGDWLGRREGLNGRARLIPPVVTLASAATGLALAATFFDMSWDGLWYHQSAVYQMAHGWNPVWEPLRDFEKSIVDSLRFYAKGPWFVALAFYQWVPDIEWAKAGNLLALVAAWLTAAALALEMGWNRKRAAMLATLVALNPVQICELVSYLVDGLMIAFLGCYAAAVMRGFRRPGLLSHYVAAAAAVLCINTKISGLVFLCFFTAAGFGYLLLRERRRLLRYSALQLAFIVLGTVIFGYNPYVTNTIHRGHPFYPWFGNATYPGFTAAGKDPVEKYETPHNMLGRNRLVRFSYALFGKPGAQPFFGGRDARLMWPLGATWKDFELFYFHEVRIGGFGPWFSGAFLLAVLLLALSAWRPGLPREVLLLLVGAIVVSLLAGLHMWWARYGPQLWLLPIVAVAAAWFRPRWRGLETAGWALAALLTVNALLLTGVHYRWEAWATQRTYQDLAMLRPLGAVEINFQWFGEPYGERLKSGGVAFRATRKLSCKNPTELMSVAAGYPGAVRACLPQP